MHNIRDLRLWGLSLSINLWQTSWRLQKVSRNRIPLRTHSLSSGQSIVLRANILASLMKEQGARAPAPMLNNVEISTAYTGMAVER